MFTPRNIDVLGKVDPGFEHVKEVFKQNFDKGDEISAQLCVVKSGKIIIDLWASSKDPSYNGNTMQTIWSSTKNLTALAIAMLVERNLMEYSDLVVKHWPEFKRGQEEKSKLTVADVLRHECGMPVFGQQIDIKDCFPENISNNHVGSIIEQEKLIFPEGEKREYHALSRGFILQEIFRRVEPNRKTVGQYLSEKVFKPLGLSAHLGLSPEGQKMNDKNSIADVVQLNSDEVFKAANDAKRDDILSLLNKFMDYNKETEGRRKDQKPPFKSSGDTFDISFWNSTEARSAEIPSAGGLASARSLAIIAGQLASGGGQLISENTFKKMHEKDTEGFVFGMKSFYTQGGVNYYKDGFVNAEDEAKETNGFVHYGQQVARGMYGWGGYGGSVFLWDPKTEIGFAYIPTYLAWYDREKYRATKCLKAFYKCLTALNKE